MSLPKYGDYKDSGIDWLPTIPVTWNVCTLKKVASLKSGDSITAEQIEEVGEYPVYGGNGLRGFTTKFTHEGRFVLIGRQGALCGNVNYAQNKFWASEHAVVAKPIKPVDTTWLGEMLRAMNLNQYSVSAAQPGLSVELISNLRIPYPPLSEQAAISAFLDRETAKIDALIAEQEKLIALLTEKRQATISHAVTRGLNPDATMKDSGVAWLGEVPAHWEVIKGSRIGTLFGSGPVSEDEVQEEGYVPFIKVGSLSSEGFDVAHWSWYVSKATAERLMPYSEFVVFPKRGAAIFLNKVNIVRCQALIDPNLMGWKIRQDISNEYVAYLLSARKLHELADVSTVPQINNRHIEPEKFPIPPFSEQEIIVQFLYAECRKLDLLKSEAERVITVLKERRSALIAAAVTGQIDVRGLVEAQPN